MDGCKTRRICLGVWRERMNLGGFSIWRLIGVSALKSRISRAIGVPLTKSGRRRKFGAFILRLFGF
jgi:hypothetical protein